MVWKQTIDLRSLALLRILLGLYLLYDVYSRLKHGRLDLLWYTSDQGWQHPEDSPHQSPVHQLWFYRGSALFQLISFALVVLLSCMFISGYYCNTGTKTILWFLVVAMQHKNMHAHDGSDTYTRHVLLWCCQLPIEQVWTLHPRNTTTTTTTTTTVQSAASLGLALQFLFMYLGTCLNRTTDLYPIFELYKSEWLPPQLSAVHYSLNSSFATRDNWMGNIIRQTPILSKIMTFSAMLIEGLAPIACLVLVKNTHYPAILLVFLHFGLLLLMNLPNWQFVGMLVTVIWIPSHVWDTWTRQQWIRPILHDSKKDDNAPPTIPQPRPRRRPYLTYFLVFYMIYNWVGERGWLSKHDGGDVGELLRFSQHWVMFGIPPKTSVHTILVGKLHSGKYVDLWNWIQSGGVTTNQFVNLEKRQDQIWNNMTHVYPSPRWERAMDGWGTRLDVHRATYFLQQLCRESDDWTEVTMIWQPLHMRGNVRFERLAPNVPITVYCS